MEIMEEGQPDNCDASKKPTMSVGKNLATFDAQLVRGQCENVEQAKAISEAVQKESWLSKVLGLYELKYPYLWKAVFIEIFATFGMVMVSIGAVLSSFGRKLGPNVSPVIDPPSLGIAVSHFFILGLLIFSFAAPSGGHMNPLISFSTMCTGHMPVARGVLYICAQCLGSTLGSWVMTVALPEASQAFSENSVGQGTLGGCASGPDITGKQQFFIEFSFSLVLVMVAYGVAFDARQGDLFGPILAPMCIAATLSLLIFASGQLVAQSSGAIMNPGRCFGPAVLIGGHNWDNHWAYWLGPFAAAILNGVVYWIAPPHHKAVYLERQARAD